LAPSIRVEDIAAVPGSGRYWRRIAASSETPVRFGRRFALDQVADCSVGDMFPQS